MLQHLKILVNKYEKFIKKETFYTHPVEMCVVRTKPNGDGGWSTFIRFSGKDEYEPPCGSGIVAESVFMKDPEWITKEEYYSF